MSWSPSCPGWAGWGWVRVGSRGWRCLHRGSSESRDALRNILWRGCNGYPTFRAHTVYTGRVSCRELWEEGGTDRADYVPKIRDNERETQRHGQFWFWEIFLHRWHHVQNWFGILTFVAVRKICFVCSGREMHHLYLTQRHTAYITMRSSVSVCAHTFLSTSSPFMCMERLLKCSSIWSVASCCSVTSSPYSTMMATHRNRWK